MSKSLFFLSLGVILHCGCLPALADQYDDCRNDCNRLSPPCIEQARLSAGNVQEEQDLIAACGQKKNDCIQACRDAEVQFQAPPPEQSPERSAEQPVQPQQPPQQQPVNEIKTYEFK
jgi:hypothetical protein